MAVFRVLMVLTATLFACVAQAAGGGGGALARFEPGQSSLAAEGSGAVLHLSLDQPVPYRLYRLADPPRLVVEFNEVDFGGAHPSEFALPPLLRSLSWGPLGPGWSRLVAEVDGPFMVASAEEKTRRADGGADLFIRIAPSHPDGFRADPVPEAGLPPAVGLPAPRHRQTGDAPLKVVLDPGHGGIDPGAESGTMTEAGLMLSFALELADKMRRAGIDVVLTREQDVFVPLETRISVARAAGADLFLSLHADALAEGEATGATVYRLAETASEAAAEKLAERHDRADLLSGVDLSGHDDLVAGVLMDLARTETQPRADRLAEALVRSIQGVGLKMHRHPIQGAAFSVLKSPDIPSLLIEVGFLSSEADRKRLLDPVWRAGMQDAILAAVQAWAISDAAEAALIRQ